MALELRPIPVRPAQKLVEQMHRHLPRIAGGLFGCSVWVDGELVGVAVASEPKATVERGKRIVEITRVATDGHKNACSRLYGRPASRSIGCRLPEGQDVHAPRRARHIAACRRFPRRRADPRGELGPSEPKAQRRVIAGPPLGARPSGATGNSCRTTANRRLYYEVSMNQSLDFAAMRGGRR